MDIPQVAQADIPTTPIEKKGSFGRFILDLFETVILSVVLFLGINALTARVLVEGFSMRPTLDNGQYVLVSKMAFRSEIPEYGDIIVFHFPVDPDQDFIKRVIGLPGDDVYIINGQVMVNGQSLNEPYIAASPQYVGEWIVPKGQIFVLGDNRNNSSDSHSWGAVPMENVIGKAIVVYWPPPDWDVIEHVQVLLANTQ
ncbi:MAG: signal peptidase I [Anaerolineae bacterium]|nr:signal peptidase I [Anaerolineae bacterium]MBT7072829.1 signal peptidase I [Anaerolineae bacterium]MBT7325817.1 signal peptidase I [Anaerolineae bacterium]MBT7600609.1 signal peptidase I [Anaerolineae bacterium]